jgi:septum site-determining protein MinD
VGLRNLDISLGLTDSGALSFLDVAEGNYSLDRAARHPVYLTLAFLTAPMNTAADEIDPEVFGRMLAQTKKEFDYVFLDAPAGVDAGFRLTARFADRFLVVTGAGPAAVRDAARVSDLLDMMGKRDVRLIVNRVDRDMLSTVKVTVDDVMDSAGLPLMGVVLEDPNVTLAAAFGKPLLQYARRSPAAKAFRKIANRIQGFREPITLR